jgi:hypothetical protein
MKKTALLTMVMAFIAISFNASAQTPKKAPLSPPDTVKATIKSGADITIAYSQPSIKGRTIGNEIAPWGKVWRTGANNATTIELSKDVAVEGKALPAGKYSIYSIPGEKEWVVIFNKTWKQWGTNYTEADDALRVIVKTGKAKTFTEQLKFAIDPKGKVSFTWGDKLMAFTVK